MVAAAANSELNSFIFRQTFALITVQIVHRNNWSSYLQCFNYLAHANPC